MDNTSKAHRRRRRGIMALMMGVAAVGSVTTATLSMAFFGASVTAAGSFGTGTIVLGVDASTTLGVVGMMPGDTVNQPLQLNNTGTGQLRYVLSSSTVTSDTKSLAPQITLTIKTLVGADCNNNAAGVTLYGPALLSASASFGSLPTPHGTARTVNAGAHDILCFTVFLPTSVGDTFQAATANVSFVFNAQQTANNP